MVIKIGFDAKRAAQNRTGLGNYSRFVINALAAYAPENEYLLYTPSPQKATLIKNLSANSRLLFPSSFLWKKLSALWRVCGVTKELRKEGVQLFHGLSNELPLNITKATGTRSIVTIHDLIFMRYPEYYSPIDRRIYTYKFHKACLHADRIIAVSECTKRDIVSLFQIPAEKIDVVYQGCDTQFNEPITEATRQEVKQKYQLPERYILYLGSIESRKNLLLLAKALKHINEPITVIAVGKRTSYANTVEEYLKANKLEGQMRLLSNIPFKELPAFYQLATTFVYPSFYEGFGIPLLEALVSKVPVIGAKGSCLEEAGGPHSLYVDPLNELELAQAIERTLTDEPLRQQMIEEGVKFAAQFNEQKLISDLWAVYQKTMG